MSSTALVEASYDALVAAGTRPSGVLKPLAPDAYLLNWGSTTMDKLDFERMRAEAIAFTEMILRLGRTSHDELRACDLP